jgi:nicotinate-nucleotide adenylyltransferase
MNRPEPVCVLGGAFDPVHNGHLHIALSLIEKFNLSQVRLLPSQRPWLKQPAQATIAQRFHMLQLAIAPYSKLCIDTRELFARQPLYSIDTVELLRDEFLPRPIWWVIGMDNLRQLPQWHRWRELLAKTHFIVINRPGYELPTGDDADQWLSERLTDKVSALHQQPAGCIHCVTLPPLAIASSTLKQQLAKRKGTADSLPADVAQYIQRQALYRKHE